MSGMQSGSSRAASEQEVAEQEEVDEARNRRFPSRRIMELQDADAPSVHVLFTYWSLMMAKTEQMLNDGLLNPNTSRRIKLMIRTWRDSKSTSIGTTSLSRL